MNPNPRLGTRTSTRTPRTRARPRTNHTSLEELEDWAMGFADPFPQLWDHQANKLTNAQPYKHKTNKHTQKTNKRTHKQTHTWRDRAKDVQAGGAMDGQESHYSQALQLRKLLEGFEGILGLKDFEAAPCQPSERSQKLSEPFAGSTNWKCKQNYN